MKKLKFTGLTSTFSEAELGLMVHRYMERHTGRLFDQNARLSFETYFKCDLDGNFEGATVRVMVEVEDNNQPTNESQVE